MSILLPLLLGVVQVGPNPGAPQADAIPPELREQRERTAAAQEQRSSRLVECLRLTGSDPQAGLAQAQSWRTSARGTDRARAGHCEGLALVRLDRFGEAQAVFLAARGEADEADMLYRARIGAMAGHAALASKNAEGAIPAFQAAIADARTGDDMMLAGQLEADLSGAYVVAGNNDAAAAALDRARQAYPDSPRAWLLSATLARRTDRLMDAQRFIERAATLGPRDPAVGLEAGVIAALARRDNDARASFASVIEVAPDSPQAAQAQRYLEQLGAPE